MFPLTCAVALSACKSADVVTASFVVSVVRDENNTAIAGARVSSTDPNLVISNDATGAFAIKGPPALRKLTFTASAPGFADRTMVVFPPALFTHVITLTMNLRPLGTQTHVTLPSGTAAPLQVSAQRTDGAATLTIPANALVLPDGSPASGDANVTMTYWHPRESMASAPAPLLTADPNGSAKPATLRSWGMSAIEIEQGGQKLQVAPGKTLPLSFTVPTSMQSLVGTRFPQPDLYYLNRDKGLWELVGTLANGDVTYAGGALSVNLPHLSEWNMDGLDATPGGPGNQGCVRGTLYNSCAVGTPLANSTAVVWFMAWEELSSFPVSTNAQGVWCLNHTTRDIMPGESSSTANTIAFYVSGPGGAANSSICSAKPIPDACAACAPLDAENGCCRFQIDYQAGTATSFSTPEAPGVGGATCNQYFSQGWNQAAIPEAECRAICPQIQATEGAFSHFLPCHICPGTVPPYGGACYADMNQPNTNLGYDNNCVDLDKVFGVVSVSDGTCPNPAGGVPAAAAPPACSPKPQGTPCVTTADCCTAALVCLDRLCVPLTDPQ